MEKRRILFMIPMAIAAGMAARSFGPQMRERCMAACEGMFEQMPDDFPPKRMLRGTEETRANTARILELLEEEQAAAEPKPPVDAVSTKEVPQTPSETPLNAETPA